MGNKVLPAPPRPDGIAEIDGQSFKAYLDENGVIPVPHAALHAYQNGGEGNWLSAEDLTHCLTLKGAREAYDNFDVDGTSPAERLGSLEDFDDPDGYDFQTTLDAIDELFRKHAVRFDTSTVLFKGIRQSEHYEYLQLHRRQVGDKFRLHGFVSTSVRRATAEQFARHGVLLVFSGIDGIDALIPPVEPVLHSPSGAEPELEVLLNRGHLFEVKQRVLERPAEGDIAELKVLYLQHIADMAQ